MPSLQSLLSAILTIAIGVFGWFFKGSLEKVDTLKKDFENHVVWTTSEISVLKSQSIDMTRRLDQIDAKLDRILEHIITNKDQ